MSTDRFEALPDQVCGTVIYHNIRYEYFPIQSAFNFGVIDLVNTVLIALKSLESKCVLPF